MRCFFHLANGHETIPDEVGIEVPNLATAKAQAFKAIRELRQEHGSVAYEWKGWRLDIVCSEGELLYSIDLDMNLQ